jgi:hypothetical protein
MLPISKFVNEFHVTVMILMDSGLQTIHAVLDKGNSRHQSIGTNHLFMLPYTYMSLTLLIIFPRVKQTWHCRDDVLPNVFYCSFHNTHLRKNINWCFEFYFMGYSWGKILEHTQLIGNLSKMIRNRYLFKLSR